MLKIYFRLMLFTSLSFFIVISILWIIILWPDAMLYPTTFTSNAITSLLYGFLMSTIFSIIHRRRMITVNGGNPPISYTPAQQNTVVIHKPVRECILRVKEFFNLHQGGRIIQDVGPTHLISADQCCSGAVRPTVAPLQDRHHPSQHVDVSSEY
jgi:hypothetical protein